MLINYTYLRHRHVLEKYSEEALNCKFMIESNICSDNLKTLIFFRNINKDYDSEGEGCVLKKFHMIWKGLMSELRGYW